LKTSGGIEAYAKHRGCSIGAVQKALATGRIKRGRGGRIHFKAADKAWAANTDIHQSSRSLKQKKTVKAPPDFPLPEVDKDPEKAANAAGYNVDGPAPRLASLAAAQLAHAVEKALAARMDRLERQGVLVKQTEVAAAAFELARRARDKLLNLSEQLAPVLVGLELDDIRDRLEAEIRKVCAELGAGGGEVQQ